MLPTIFDISEYVVPITGSEPTHFGTGFVIYKDDEKTYLLTCRHVIDAIGDEKTLLANYSPARVIASLDFHGLIEANNRDSSS
jgi:hypothetical protein